MKKYELTFLISVSLEEAKRDELVEKVSTLITSKGGKIEKLDKLGMRRLAYPIKFKNEAFFVMAVVEIDGAQVAPLSKALNITENIIRYSFIAC